MTRPRNRLAPRTYHEVEEIVVNAVAYGFRRAHKHTDTPSEEHTITEIAREVMSALGDVILWPRSGK